MRQNFESFCVRAFNLRLTLGRAPLCILHTLWRIQVCTACIVRPFSKRACVVLYRRFVSSSCLHTCGIHTRQADREAMKGSNKEREKSLFLCLYRATPRSLSRRPWGLRGLALGPGGRVLLLEWELQQDMQKVDDQGETFPKAVPLCMAGWNVPPFNPTLSWL